MRERQPGVPFGRSFFPIATQAFGRGSLVGLKLGHYRIIEKIDAGGRLAPQRELFG
jgi:hypothetical protein